MNDQRAAQQYTPFMEAADRLTADSLLMEAVDSIGVIIPPHVDNTASALLIGFHALIAKLDSMETQYIDAQRDLRESIDFLAARPAGEVVPTASESERMFGILKADWLRQHPEHTEAEYREAMRRFEILAGL